MRRLIAIAAIMAAVLSPSGAQAQQLASTSDRNPCGATPVVGPLRFLTGQELYSLLAGHTLRGQAKKDCRRYTMQFGTDGQVSASMEWSQVSTPGQWSIVGNEVEIHWRHGESESWGLRTDGQRYFSATSMKEVLASIK